MLTTPIIIVNITRRDAGGRPLQSFCPLRLLLLFPSFSRFPGATGITAVIVGGENVQPGETHLFGRWTLSP
jgi:hypothetical protein